MKALSIKGLAKTYANGVVALKGIDLDVEEGDFFALLGPNGAGKSTAIGITAALVNKTGGSVEVFGHNIETELEAAKSCIGLVPQEMNFNHFEKVIDIVVNQAGYYGVPRPLALERAETYLKELHLWDKRNEVSRNLSGGMKRRLLIARALVHEPRLLILDEPTAGVDIEIRRSMWEFLQRINKAGTTIILTTHYLEEAESMCRNIAIIDGGEIIINTDMKTLLSEVDIETFVLTLDRQIDDVSALAAYHATMIDSNTLEVEISKSGTLNDLFAILTNLGIGVLTMRNKANRLEQLFVSLVDNGGPSK